MVFSYYGSKSKLLKHYPPPKHGAIIEPFAGSAKYSLAHPENEVTLIEINPIVYDIWRWLIKEATPNDIASLPELRLGQDLRNFKSLSIVERNLLGFAVTMGEQSPCHVMTRRAYVNREPARLKARILSSLPKIKHWKVIKCSWDQYKINARATWFVDPPYDCKAGRRYTYSDVDYCKLGKWCRARSGLVIVCEQVGANWLPFTPLPTKQKLSRYPAKEAIWIRDQ